MTTKRRLERKLEALEETSTTGRDRIEVYFDGIGMYEPEPELTDALGSRGFVVERDVHNDENGGGYVQLHTTPSASTVFGRVSWYRDGPTADPNDVRIVWEADRLETVLADAEYPAEYAEPDVPAEAKRTVVAEGAGWVAVVPSDRVITNMVQRRGDAEYHGFDILGPVELQLDGADEYDLVEVNAAPDGDRQPRRSDR